MDIRILPENLANMIAAGEVVQRPASVVKELVENSVDAGAAHISVIIKDAGRTLIQVIDDGKGMSPDDAVLCFERHATSKLATPEDLSSILTFGFRGEALASIAAVAQVTLKTRREEDEIGCEVEFAASRQLSNEEASCPKGCNISVRDLFYNVPARRKFLKSDNVEFKHIVSEFTHIALTRPEIAFTLIHNDKEVYVLRAAKSLKFRIQDLLGSGAASEVLDISVQTSVVNISGYVGRPDTAKKGLGSQYFFVNGRFFRSPYFHKAVMKAYENLIPADVTPSYFIFLDVPPHEVDVNVSPTKTEIKFEEDSIIFQSIYACVKEAMGRESFGGSIDFDRGDAPEIPVFSSKYDEYHPVTEPKFGQDSEFNPFDGDGFPSEPDTFNVGFGSQASGFGTASESQAQWSGNGSGWTQGTGAYVAKDQNYGKLFEDRSLPSTTSLVLQGKFILTAVRSGLMVVNIRRAKERVLFERFLSALSRGEHIIQTALFPEAVEVGVEGRLLFEENAEMLRTLGFDIRPFGNDTVVVNGVPEGYSASQGSAHTIVDNLLSALREGSGLLEETMTATMAEKFARIGASTCEPLTSPVQAQRLIDSLFACSNAEFTASGRRTMTIIPMDEIEKKF